MDGGHITCESRETIFIEIMENVKIFVRNSEEMDGEMPNLFKEYPQIIHVNANEFVPVSGRMRFNPQNKPVHGAIILVYAPWCPHCNDREWQEKYSALGNFLNRNGSRAYAMNATVPANLEWTDKMNINGLPTILMANRQGEMREYEGDRELTPMVKDLVDYLVKTNEKPKRKGSRR